MKSNNSNNPCNLLFLRELFVTPDNINIHIRSSSVHQNFISPYGSTPHENGPISVLPIIYPHAIFKFFMGYGSLYISFQCNFFLV